MKYIVDPALCCGSGQCYALAPDVFEAADDGYNAESGNTVEVPPGLEAAAWAGFDGLPGIGDPPAGVGAARTGPEGQKWPSTTGSSK